VVLRELPACMVRRWPLARGECRDLPPPAGRVPQDCRLPGRGCRRPAGARLLPGPEATLTPAAPAGLSSAPFSRQLRQMQARRRACSGTRSSRSAGKIRSRHQHGAAGASPGLAAASAQRLGSPQRGQRVGSGLAIWVAVAQPGGPCAWVGMGRRSWQDARDQGH
jgi:hypothetical protein